jgi:hypothetical protein
MKLSLELGEKPLVLDGEVFDTKATTSFVPAQQFPACLALAPMTLRVSYPDESLSQCINGVNCPLHRASGKDNIGQHGVSRLTTQANGPRKSTRPRKANVRVTGPEWK